MRLVLNRCEIRSWERSDVRSLARQANNRKIWRYVRDQFPYPYSTADAEVWIRTARSMRPETAFAIVVDVGLVREAEHEDARALGEYQRLDLTQIRRDRNQN